MTLRICLRLFCLTVLLLMAACSNHAWPSKELAVSSRENFVTALRWGKIQSAAVFIHTDHREAFLAVFEPLKDLHITDVRLVELQPREDDNGFDTTIEMDYYLLPSVSIKTMNIDQRWEFFSGEESAHKGYFIVTAFPGFP